MVLNPLKRSRHGGNTVDLFEFTYGEGEGDKFRYTTAERNLTVESATFQPIAIERDTIKKKGREQGSSFKVKVPRTSGIAQMFQGTPPRRVVFLRIFEGDIPEFDSPSQWSGDETISLIWSGRVLEAQHKQDHTILSCDTLGAGMKRPGLHRFYQRECAHILYGPRCQANKELATYNFAVQSYDPTNRTIPLPANWVSETERVNFIGGTLEWDGPYGTESRVIKSANSVSVEVDSPVNGLLFEGDPIRLVLGCPRTPEACAQLHNSIVNYGGTPYIPTEDPHGKNNHT